MVTRYGVVKVLDFGLAGMDASRQSVTFGPCGTAAYMSPEQARGGSVDCRADVWSLGVVLYEALAGERPFRGEPPSALLRAIIEDEPEPLQGLRPRLPEPIIRIVATALAKRSGDRYDSAAGMRDDLWAAASIDSDASGRPRSASSSSERPLLPRLRPALLATLGLVALAGPSARRS